MRRIAALFLALALLLPMGALAEENQREIHWGILAGIETVDLTGTYDIGGNVPVQRYDVYMTMDSLVSGLMNGRSDACYINESIANYIVNRNPGIESEVMPDQGKLRFMMGVTQEKAELFDRLNAALTALIDDGTVAALTDEWIDNFPADREPDFREPLTIEGASETIVVGVTGDMPPIDYMAVDGTPSGFNVALLQKLGQKLNANIELVSLASEARIVALASGRIDVAFWINSVDAAQGNFIDGVLLTEPYASSDICMIYTAGQRDRIMRMTEQIHKTENIMAAANEEEIYAFGHADRDAMNAIIALVYEAPEMTLTETEGVSAREWALTLGDTPLASGSVAMTEETVDRASTLTPGALVRTAKRGANRLDSAIQGAEFAPDAARIEGADYASSATVSFSMRRRSAYQMTPILSYLMENGNVKVQAEDLLDLMQAQYEGKVYRSEAGDAMYLDAAASGERGTALRVFGTLGGGSSKLVLLAGRKGANLEDAEAFRAGVADGSVEGMALVIDATGNSDGREVCAEGVSTNFGLFRAPSVRIGLRGQTGGETSRYTFSALGVDVFSLNVVRQSGEAAAPGEGLSVVDGDAANEALFASIGQGLQALRDALADTAPLTSAWIASALG